MPSAYTAPILENPRFTFEQFALRCARQFGMCIHERDESMDVEPQPLEIQEHYRKSLEDAEAEVRKYEVMTEAEAAKLCEAEHADTCRWYEEIRTKHAAENALYEKMLSEVEAWEPPTVDHRGLKVFMLEQITQSMTETAPSTWEVPEKEDSVVWLGFQRKRAAESCARARETWEKHQRSVEHAAVWLAELRASLVRSRSDHARGARASRLLGGS